MGRKPNVNAVWHQPETKDGDSQQKERWNGDRSEKKMKERAKQMDAANKIHELLNELASVISAQYPNASQSSVTIGNDGYISYDVCEWEEHPIGEAAKAKYRYLMMQRKSIVDGKWSSDLSSEHNRYLSRHRRLLRGDN